MSASDWAAWYAAIVATVVAVFDFVKWSRSGPRIKADIRTGQKLVGMPEYGDADIILVNIANIGAAATTVTHCMLECWPKGVNPSEKTSERRLVILQNDERVGKRLPVKIELGDTWACISPESDAIRALLSEGTVDLYCVFSHTEKALRARLKRNPGSFSVWSASKVL
jgi:hypothetical protein